MFEMKNAQWTLSRLQSWIPISYPWPPEFHPKRHWKMVMLLARYFASGSKNIYPISLLSIGIGLWPNWMHHMAELDASCPHGIKCNWRGATWDELAQLWKYEGPGDPIFATRTIFGLIWCAREGFWQIFAIAKQHRPLGHFHINVGAIF